MVRRIVVVGGSSGALLPLSRVLADLPGDFSAATAVVLHSARGPELSSQILAKRSKVEVLIAEDGREPKSGSVYLAPFDRHLLFEAKKIHVVRGPRENRQRPSIDVLFRSAAVEFGADVIALLLSGTMKDGVAGLQAVKRCGGTTIVQSPDDASFPDLPKHALEENVVDHAAAASEIAELLLRLAASEAFQKSEIPEDLKVEARHAALGMVRATETREIGKSVELACPHCGGPLYEVSHTSGSRGGRYRCEVGHAFTTDVLLEEQGSALEQALWVAFRTLKERSDLVRTLAENAEQRGFNSSAVRYREAIEDLEEHSDVIKHVLSSTKRMPDTEE